MTSQRVYTTLISAYVDGRLTGDEFALLFISLFKTDPGGHAQAEYEALQGLFGQADSYCSDDELRDETMFEIGDAEFLTAARAALDVLAQLAADSAVSTD